MNVRMNGSYWAQWMCEWMGHVISLRFWRVLMLTSRHQSHRSRLLFTSFSVLSWRKVGTMIEHETIIYPSDASQVINLSFSWYLYNIVISMTTLPSPNMLQTYLVDPQPNSKVVCTVLWVLLKARHLAVTLANEEPQIPTVGHQCRRHLKPLLHKPNPTLLIFIALILLSREPKKEATLWQKLS